MSNPILRALSAEFLLDSRPNSGGVVLVRALWMAPGVYLSALAIKVLIDPAVNLTVCALRTEVVNTLPWFGTILGAIYFALHSRFGSQWTYLADVYNQIKASEIADGNQNHKAMAQWKAGFIEDATVLHLATKGVFASVINHWAKDEKVLECIDKHPSPSMKLRLQRVIEKTRQSLEQDQ